MHPAKTLGAVALVLSLVGVSGCAVEPYPSGVYAEGGPVDMYSYPHVSYGGGYAYLVGDRWYYPSEGRWVELRREPPELYRYRVTYGHRGSYGHPGYPDHHGVYQQGPDNRRYVPPTQYGYPRPAEHR